MKRLQLYFEEDLYHQVSAIAHARGCSRAAVIRDSVRAQIGSEMAGSDARQQLLKDDPITALIGSVKGVESGDIDDVVYGPRSAT